MTIPETFQVALQYQQSGRLAEAESLYRQILAVQPNHADALHFLGVIAHQIGRDEVAIDLIHRAIALAPNSSVFHSNLGEAYRKAGRVDEAVAAYRRAIHLDPENAKAHNNLGNALWCRGHLDEAIAACRRAILLQPGYAEAHSNLGNAMRDQGRIEEAIAACRQAIQLKPDCAEAHCNLGNAFRDQGHLNEAIAAYRQAILLKPDFAEAHNNLGNTLRDQGHLDEALAAYRRAIEFKAGYAAAHWNISLLLLLQGDFEHGWPLFETRWDGSDSKHSKRNFAQPMWKGEPLNGRRVLIHSEQGFGDTLQFVRYAPLAGQLGGQVIVECQPGLKALLAGIEGVSQIIERGESLPAFDLHIPMMSLPLAFGTRVETIPAAIPYLQADPLKSARWRERLQRENAVVGAGEPPSGSPLKVGLVWAGGERPLQPKLRPVNQRRSLHLDQFAPLADVPGVVFVSLQKGPPATQAKAQHEGMRLLDWTDELEDFSDTAALVECLDLVISVDTAVAHLAGAMGKPVWLLNRFDTCWRWFREREDSPWYPTMRLFRQPHYGDWEPVMNSVREQLTLLAKGGAPVVA